MAKANLINSGCAATSASGVIVSCGVVTNRAHAFHGGTVKKLVHLIRKGKVTAQEQAAFSSQVRRIMKYFPEFQCSSKKNILKCIGSIRPDERSPRYMIEIGYPMGGKPYVSIKSPDTIAKARTHVYIDGFLCLYDPHKMPWQGTNNIHETIIPWIAEWLVFYELFLIEGKWLGPETCH